MGTTINCKGENSMKSRIILSGLILMTLIFVACVNGEMVNGQAEATFVVS